VKSFETSFSGLFLRRSPRGTTAISGIEIPLIQRDYAQGREDAAVKRIRASFLGVLHAAVTGTQSVSLDFVYGDVDDAGTLRPLDGQQRLTTLFLLHWFLASRAGRLQTQSAWKRFSYATRPGARLFCERLAEFTPPLDQPPAAAIQDQPWYQYVWRHDPTIQSMLVMLDAIYERFGGEDCAAAWERLTSDEQPAVTFQLLPVAGSDMGPGEELYIKMNSRGKPLTEFENFKARFEKRLEASVPGRAEEFARKVDGVWSDAFWPYHGGDFIIDQEFLRYFRFVTEVCEWRAGRAPAPDIDSLAEGVYGPANPAASANLDFLFAALDIWVDADIAGVFAELFSSAPAPVDGGDTRKVVLYAQHDAVEIDFFKACCRDYGAHSGKNRTFSLPDTLLLYAVVLHRVHKTANFPRQLRVVRNLIEASENEIRLERMPTLVADVERIVVQGNLDGVSAFNQAQVADEQAKADFLKAHPSVAGAMFHLEDHPVLRGCLGAFELDPNTFASRAAAFHRVFAALDKNLWRLTAALLATGNYARRFNSRSFLLGSRWSTTPWRELLTAAPPGAREALGRLLDEVADTPGDVHDTLDLVRARWLAEREAMGIYCWRYYLVKYDAMREGRSGIYYGRTEALGYDLCMLEKRWLNSWYRDPYLLAMHRLSGVGAAVDQDMWFMGYETDPRWMSLVKSGVALRSVKDGIAVRPPPGPRKPRVSRNSRRSSACARTMCSSFRPPSTKAGVSTPWIAFERAQSC
jgi:hypothetical protein